MLSALKQLGIRKAIRFFYTRILEIIYKFMIFPQLRIVYLRLCGAKIGKGTIICSGVRFINLHWNGFKNLNIGDYCWIAEEAMFDLADEIDIGNYVGIGWRTLIITHLNVGFSDHPLQKHFPRFHKPVIISDGVFVGPYCVVHSGITIDEKSYIIPQTMVARDVPANVVYGGIPGKIIRKIDE